MAGEWDEITVVGAGAIGGNVAAFLARAGENVIVVDRSVPHIEAIRSNGLLADGAAGEYRATFRNALFPNELKGPLGFVVLAVKSQDTEEALSTLAPLLSQNGFIVSLQNGLNERRIAEAVGPGRTIGAMVHMPALLVGPGHVRRSQKGQFYVGELDGGEADRIQKIARTLSQAVSTQVVGNIWGYLWSKLIYSCHLVATALVDEPSDQVLAPEWSKRIFVALMGEAAEVALAEGVTLEPYDRFNPLAMIPKTSQELSRALGMLPAGSGKEHSGTWYEIKSGRKTQTEFTTGEVARLGKTHGLPMPLNGQVAQMITEIEQSRRTLSWDNLRSLEKAANTRLPK